MVSVICVTAGLGSRVSTRLLPPVMPVTLTLIWLASRYGLSLGARGTLTVPVSWPDGMVITAPLDRVMVRSLVPAWVTVAVYVSTPPASVMLGVALRLRVEGCSARLPLPAEA
ncbi:hypothetical protein [Pseudomonas sp. 31 R 17]|nr:hypothetical protein [Pseudomonas sp. 31 R 17]